MIQLPQEIERKAWEALPQESRAYGEAFVQTYRPFVQDQLDLGRFAGLDEAIGNERIIANTDLERGLIGGELDFIRSLSQRAFYAGILGYFVPDYDAEVDATEQSICVEDLDNEFEGQPVVTKKQDGQPYFIEILTKPELAARLAYWYERGASNRMAGFVEERRKLDEKENA